jgi:hypothetical protein
MSRPNTDLRKATGLWNASYGEVGATLKVFEDLGVTLDDLKAIRADKNLACRMVEVLKAPRGIIYDARAVNALFSLGYLDEEDINALDPPPEALPGFLTFFCPNWNILRLRNFCADKGNMFSDEDLYDREAFAMKTEAPRYRQIRLEAVGGSFGKTFRNQQLLQLMRPENEEVPTARVVIMGMVIHFLLSEQRLFENVLVRCADTTSVGRRVCVGNFGSSGFRFHKPWDERGSASLGLASSRKF